MSYLKWSKLFEMVGVYGLEGAKPLVAVSDSIFLLMSLQAVSSSSSHSHQVTVNCQELWVQWFWIGLKSTVSYYPEVNYIGSNG